MNWFRSVGITALAWVSTIRVASRLRIWGPLLLVAVLKGAGLLALYLFHLPALVSFMGPVVEELGGEAATHYPDHLFALPSMIHRWDPGMSVLVVPLALGATTLRFAEAFGFPRMAGRVRILLRAAPTLVLVRLATIGLLEGVRLLLGTIPDEFRYQSMIVRLGLLGVEGIIMLLIETTLAYTTALVVLLGHPFWPAIRDSGRLAVDDFLAAFLAVGIPVGLLFPFSLVWREVDLSQSGIMPETVVILLGSQILAELLLAFLMMGTVTRLLVWRIEAAR